MGKNKKLIVIVGPTASGKTTLAIQKAKEYQTEIVSADSRQIYKELNIGVARPSNEELDLVHHHLIANTSIHEPYDVSKFESQALDAIKGIFAQNDVAILVGGTGLYINAVLYGLDPIPLVDDSILKTLNTEWETNKSVLLEELKRYDPNFYNEVDIHNSRRVLRALSVIRQTQTPFSSYRSGNKLERDFEIELIKLIPDREQLYLKINQRVDHMLLSGLEEEAFLLKDWQNLKALDTVGYREWWPYFNGVISYYEVIDKIKQHTRNYAKRQMTWWRKY